MSVHAGSVVVWPVDSLDKVFRDAMPGEGDGVSLEACRNEYTSAQLAVRASAPVRDLQVKVPALEHEAAGAGGVEVRARFVGFVPVKENTPDTAEEELIRAAPFEVPDVLLEQETVALEADATQPVWLTISVPPDAPAGAWRGAVEVSADGKTAEVPILLVVHPIALPAERNLWVTNWVNMGNFARFFGTELYTERFWSVVERFARTMAEHRQNVILCPSELIHITEESEGRFSFDFSNWDRWVETFDRAGCAKLIEGGHLGRRGEGKWETPWFEWRKFAVHRPDGSRAEPDPEQVVEQFARALHAHVRKRGWLDRFVMHVVDEPASHTEEDYKKKCGMVREWMPGVRFLEAMSLLDARGYLDIWVPELSHFHEHMDNYLKMGERGEAELWFYTCMFPTGRYPNRFLDFSLLKTRILHWINWRWRLSGYLHWGLNFWADDPFAEDRLPTNEKLPPGDCWIVYPGADRPLESIRWEQMREGIQDYELLRLLDERAREAGKSEGRADEICRELVPDPVSYRRNAAALRSARRAAIEALLSL